MPSFEIAGKKIGEDAPVYFVAELSANHGNSLDKALQTVDAAAKAGADAIKLQTYTPDTLTLKSNAPPFVVKTKNVWAGRTLHDLYAEAMTPWEWHKNLIDAAKAHGLACFSTPFDATATHFLHDLDVPAYKIASFELIDLPLVEQVARLGKPIIMSTGMASLGEIDAAVQTCVAAGNTQISILRCVSAYPADPRSMDLRSMEMLKQFGMVVGLSDHTRDNVAALAAVSLGAKLIEKHFIVDRSWGGPDAFFSLEPDDFKRLIADVRTCEASLGKPRFGPGPEEAASVAFRRSLFVARDVKAGEILTADDVRSVRPSNGLAPKFLPEVLGRTAAHDLKAADPLTWGMVGGPPSGPAVTLRPATTDDARALLDWRNDPDTRANSWTTAGVSAAEHAKWLEGVLGSATRKLFIAELDGKAIGQVRLDGEGHGLAEISITIAPESRGKGLSPWVLRKGSEAAEAAGLTTLRAEIKGDNQKSLNAFKRAGYHGFVAHDDAKKGKHWTCERRVTRFPS